MVEVKANYKKTKKKQSKTKQNKKQNKKRQKKTQSTQKMNQVECLKICLWIRYGQVYNAVFVYVPLLWIKVHKANLVIPWIYRKRLSANKIDVNVHSVHRKQLVHRNFPESGFSAYTNAGFSTK